MSEMPRWASIVDRGESLPKCFDDRNQPLAVRKPVFGVLCGDSFMASGSMRRTTTGEPRGPSPPRSSAPAVVSTVRRSSKLHRCAIPQTSTLVPPKPPRAVVGYRRDCLHAHTRKQTVIVPQDGYTGLLPTQASSCNKSCPVLPGSYSLPTQRKGSNVSETQ